jgi:hypothetical protein
MWWLHMRRDRLVRFHDSSPRVTRPDRLTSRGRGVAPTADSTQDQTSVADRESGCGLLLAMQLNLFLDRYQRARGAEGENMEVRMAIDELAREI